MWLLVSFVASCDVVFDLYAMLGGVFIKQRFFLRKMAEFSFGRFGCSQFHGKHRGVLLSMLAVEQLQECCKVDFVS